MKKLMVVIIVLITSISCNNKKEEKDKEEFMVLQRTNYPNGQVKQELTVYLKDTNVTVVKVFHESGKLKSIGGFYKRKKEGKWQFYDEQGKLTFEGFFKNGKQDSVHKIYVDGKLLHEKYFVNGEPKGTWVEYDTLTNSIKNQVVY